MSSQLPVDGLTAAELQLLHANLHKMSPTEQEDVLQMLDLLEEQQSAKRCRGSLIEFAKKMQPDYKVGEHHLQLAEVLEDMAYGRKSRAIVNMPPRFGKSQLTSIFFPAWLIGNFPSKQVMMVSHTADLAVEFGRKVRNLVATEEYQKIFPDVSLATDSKSAGRWNTNKGGSYFACGIGGALAGRGANFLCLSADAKLLTRAGSRRADEVKVGDYLWGFAGFERVEKVFTSTHTAHREVDGVKMTHNHPVWTHDRGWVRAGQLTTHNVVDTVSLWSYGRLYLEILYEQTNNARRKLLTSVQHLGDDAATLQQPERGELPVVWRAWNYMLCAMGVFCGVPAGYGAPSQRESNFGSNQQRRALHPGQLPVDRPGDTSVQSAQRGQDNGLWPNPFAVPVDEKNSTHERSDKAPHLRYGNGAGTGAHIGADELGAAPRSSDEFGWLKRAAVWVISRSRQSNWRREGLFMGCAEKIYASRVFGLLVGVRRLSQLTEYCGSSNIYYNFQVSESNTFYVGGLMTHNCIDDPHNEQDILNGNYEVFEKAYDWYAYGARTRLMPGGAVAIVATRWAQADLAGRLIQDMVRKPDGDQWDLVEFPALFPVEGVPDSAPDVEKWASLWPAQWSTESLLQTRENMPPFQWQAQYMQDPTAEEAAIIKREWWRKWEKDEPPACEYIIMSLDAAAEKNNRADFTALTTWGVFYRDSPETGKSTANIILLNCIKKRLEFPELKRLAHDEYMFWKPDWFVIEKKSSGTPLYQELRTGGIPVQAYTPHRGTGDKFARLNSVADIFASGMVWYPPGRRWAEEAVDEICSFPAAPNDDIVDTAIMALMRFRNSGFIVLSTDYFDDDDFVPVRANYY